MSPKTEEERLEMNNKPYLQVLGSVGYAANSTRPDLQFAYGMAARFASNPGLGHWKGLKRMLHYLKETKEFGLTFRRDKSEKAITVTGYVDSDWAGCTDTRRSTTGYIFLVSGAPVSWSSKVQKTVARSSVEAEYMALSAAAQEAVYLRTLIEELGFKVQLPMTIFQDNQGSIFLAEGKGNHGRTKHIDIRHHFIRDLVEEKVIQVTYIPSNRNVADIFTKPLDQLKFGTHRAAMMSTLRQEPNRIPTAALFPNEENSGWACMLRDGLEVVTHSSPREGIQEPSIVNAAATTQHNNISPSNMQSNNTNHTGRTHAPRDIDDLVSNTSSMGLEEGTQDIQPTDPVQNGATGGTGRWETSWADYDEEMSSAQHRWAAQADTTLPTEAVTQGAPTEAEAGPSYAGESAPEAAAMVQDRVLPTTSSAPPRNVQRNQQRRERRWEQAAAQRRLEAQPRRPHREVRLQRHFQPHDPTRVGSTITVTINVNPSSPGAEPQGTRRRCQICGCRLCGDTHSGIVL
jgi:hypothetical protein